MRFVALLLGLVAVALVKPGTARAQVAGSTGFESWEAGGPPDGGKMTLDLAGPAAGRGVATVGLGALGGAVVGVLVGGAVGYYIEHATECDDDFCGLGGIFAGGSVGSTLLTPVGAHLANGRRGSLLSSLAAAAAGTGVVWMIAAGSGDEDIALAVPLVNIVTSVLVERSSSDR